MSGFLGGLVQRTLASMTDVRPRPVSVFESTPPPPVDDALRATILGAERKSVDGERFGADAAHRPDPWMNFHGDSTPGQPLELRSTRPRPEGRRAALFAGGDPSAHAAVQTAAAFVEEETPAPFVEHPRRRHRLTKETGESADRYKPVKGVPEAGPLPEAAELEAVTPTEALPPRRLDVKGRLFAQPKSQNPETRPEALLEAWSLVEGRVTMPTLNPDQGVRNELTDWQKPSEPETELTVSSPSQFADPQRKLLPARLQAVLVPRLPQLDPIARPVQPPTARAAEPAIHVTIGRVEIRAVSTPAAQKRSVPLKPSLSLSDYLDGRRGGH